MGKKASSASKKGPITKASSQLCLQHTASITLREESIGKKQKPVGAKSMLKLDHIKNLAIWASGEASIPSLGAFFGHRLAATAEALDVPPDPSLFTCQRAKSTSSYPHYGRCWQLVCESILQPGFNCTVRIEKNKAKVRHRRKKANLAMQNSVVYKCHSCSHRNLKRGTARHYMKELCPPKIKPTTRLDPRKLTIQEASKSVVVTESKDDTVKMGLIALPKIAEDNPMIHAPGSPVTTVGTTLLDSKRRKRTRPGAKKAAESGSSSAVTDAETGTSNKRKRKTWTSLKEIAELEEQENRRNFTNLAIPFVI